MQIIVVGAGIVGLGAAWWLARDGHDVTVVDQAAEVGQGTSFANGAQLSYSYVAPMAQPSVIRDLPKYLFNPASPVRFTPTADPGQWLWALRFLGNCTAARSAETTGRLLALSGLSRTAMADMQASTPMQFQHASNGKLVVQSTQAGMAAAEAQMRLQATMGCEQFALTAAECLALEPGLQSIAARLVGGIHTPTEEVGDCHMLCQEMRRVLTPQVNFMLGTHINEIATTRGRVVGLRTAQGSLEADLYVLAAGPGSRTLAGPASVRLPIQPVRGYSITAQVRPGNAAPVRSITDIYRKTVYAPLGSALRVAGFAEISGRGTALRPDRVAVLTRTLEETFPGVCDMSDVQPWCGLRPATPRDLPVIGRSRLDNLLLNVGHGSLGFTLSAGSGRLLADIVAGRPTAIPAEPYAPNP
jgi:D-amino-acid dehydrogenase